MSIPITFFIHGVFPLVSICIGILATMTCLYWKKFTLFYIEPILLFWRNTIIVLNYVEIVVESFIFIVKPFVYIFSLVSNPMCPYVYGFISIQIKSHIKSTLTKESGSFYFCERSSLVNGFYSYFLLLIGFVWYEILYG